MIHAEGTDARFDFEEGGGLVKYFGWEFGGLHDCFARIYATGDRLEDEGFDIGIADEVFGPRGSVFFCIFSFRTGKILRVFHSLLSERACCCRLP